MSFRHRKKDSTGVPGFERTSNSSTSRRIWLIVCGASKARITRLLTRFPGDPAGASRSPMVVEGKINGMVGSLGGHQHRGDGGDVDLARGGVRGCRCVA